MPTPNTGEPARRSPVFGVHSTWQQKRAEHEAVCAFFWEKTELDQAKRHAAFYVGTLASLPGS